MASKILTTLILSFQIVLQIFLNPIFVLRSYIFTNDQIPTDDVHLYTFYEWIINERYKYIAQFDQRGSYTKLTRRS